MRQSPALSRGIVSFVILDSPFCHPRLPLLSSSYVFSNSLTILALSFPSFVRRGEGR